MSAGTTMSFDTVGPQRRGFDTVVIRLGPLGKKTGQAEKLKQLEKKDLNGGRAGTRTPDLLRVKQAL